MDQPFHNSPLIPTFLDLNEEQPQHDHDIFNLNTQISLSPPLMINNPPQDHDHGEFYYREQPQRFQLQAPLKADHKNIFSSGGSYFDDHSEYRDLKLSIWKNNDIQDHTNDHKNQMITSGGENFDDSVKWISSKMRIMRKMIVTNPDHQTNSSNNHRTPTNFTHSFDHRAMKKHSPTPNTGTDQSSSSSSNNNGAIRVCSDCNTTKTPLWRSGPRGPKSLCNACGIRQRKARKALAAATAAVNGTITTVNTTPMKKITKKYKEKKTKVKADANCVNSPIKKRGRKKLLYFEDLRISMSKNSSFERVFPQDEKDAAILLMALSYGLVHG